MKLKNNITLKILIFAQILLVFSCRTNKVAKNEYLFISNSFKYLDKKGAPYLDHYGNTYLNEKGEPIINKYSTPFLDELSGYVKQKPNRKILFYLPLGLWLYDVSDPKFDSVYSEYYSVNPKLRNQNLLDSLYIKYNLNKYVGRSRWIDRFFYNNGEAPVTVDAGVSKASVKNLQKYFVNRGWRKAIVTDTLLTTKRKAKVQYDIQLDRPMTIGSVKYDIDEGILDPIYSGYLWYVKNRLKNKKDTISKEKFIYSFFGRDSIIKKGDRLDAYVFENEISKLENRFKNLGYYGFNDLKDEVIFYVDTAKSIYEVPVTLKIRKSALNNYTSTDSIKSDTIKKTPHFKRFTYSQVNVTLDRARYQPNHGISTDSAYYVIKKKEFKRDNLGKKIKINGKKIKTITRDSIFIINKSGGRYKNRVLSDMMVLKIGDTYRLNSEIETRRNIYKVNNFNILGFNTFPVKDSDSTLISNIILTPMDKYSYEIGFESFSSRIANFGITPNVTFTAKNLFRGAENLSITFGGSLGNIESKKNNDQLFNASEISAQASLSFPRLLFPFHVRNLVPKNWGPSSAISVGYNAQYNIGLDRRNYNAGISYNFTPTRTTIHQITLWNLQYTQFLNPGNYFNIYEQDRKTRNRVYDQYFIYNPVAKVEYHDTKTLKDDQLLVILQDDRVFQDYLRNNDANLYENYYNLVERRRYRFTQSVLISSFKYDFTYDQRLGYFSRKNPFYFRSQIEFAGNVTSLFNSSLKDFKTSNNKIVKEIFGVPYSQFVKLDVDIREYWNFSGKKSLNTRFFVGIGIPYGNSFDMPFDRSYSVGGPSDVRAWKAFGFGPGTSKLGTRDGYELVALDNFKLFSSVEYRFPLPSKGFEGALFVDAGNVWGTQSHSLNKFEFDSFYKELGMGGGWGIRWNISNFIIRFDFAYKFHDPTRKEDDRWYFKYIKPLKPQVNFAIDYPF